MVSLLVRSPWGPGWQQEGHTVGGSQGADSQGRQGADSQGRREQQGLFLARKVGWHVEIKVHI